MKNKKIHLLNNNNVVCGTEIKKGVYNYLPFKLFYSTPKKEQCQSCLKTNYYKEQLEKMEKERVASSEELGKTQLEIDTEKYNLSDEHVEYLKGFDYEPIQALFTGGCSSCIFGCVKFNGTCNGIKCFMEIADSKGVIFKQVHKTQESLNKSIEKERDNEPVEEPFNKPDAYKNTPLKYKITVTNRNSESIECDIYDLINALKIINPAHAHSFKKVACPGIRGAKSFDEDIKEAIESLEIARKLEGKWIASKPEDEKV